MGRRRQDHYARRARKEGYPARSIYKLEALDLRWGLLGPGDRVLDLGCAPGSWLIYAARRVGARGRILGVDRDAVPAPPPGVRTLVADVMETAPERLMEPAASDPGGPFHVVLSDMAPGTTGDRWADHVRSVALARRAATLAAACLAPGGRICIKVFDGELLRELTAELRPLYERLKPQRPQATRRESREVYLVGLGFVGARRSP
ncbi:MAG: RlmE family RNA methyltransferase [Planctomycetes bacterium]|nr:RlmE family RNA methyltransferase [Planctomycetota bacterium]